MQGPTWTRLDFGLLGVASAGALALPLVRTLWIVPALMEAIRPLEYLESRFPRVVMLGLSGYTIWGGLLLLLALAAGGAVVRSRASKVAGRLLLVLAGLVAPGAVVIEWSAVLAARDADPADFGADGVTRCPCPDSLLVSDGSACGCNDEDLVVVVLVDKDFDRRADHRCLTSPPCSERVPCVLRCEPSR